MKSYYLFKIASWLSRWVPARIAYWFCSVLGGIVFYLSPGIRRAVLENLGHVLPQSSRRERRRLGRNVVRHVLKNYYDLVRLCHLKASDVEKMIPAIEGRDNLDNALKLGKGAICFSGHIGNFSLVAQIGAILGYSIAIVAEDIKPEKLYNFINRLRGQFGLKLIKTGSSQVRTIYKLLRGNGLLLLAVDRDVSDSGVPVRFFDGLVDMPEGPVVLSLRLGTPLIPLHTVRLPNNKCILTIHPPLELERTGDYETDVKVNMRKMAQAIEGLILNAPDQWVVLQRMWTGDYTGSTAESQDDAAPEGPASAESLPLSSEAPQDSNEPSTSAITK